MQGKTVNTNFINDFIVHCAEHNKNSPQDVCREAKQQIININQELISLNKLKETKNSLLDVISTFGNYKPSKKRDREQLPFFGITMKHAAHTLCTQLINQSLMVEDLSTLLYTTIDQLKELEIVNVIGTYLTQGRNFDLFLFHFMKKHYGL